MHVLSTPDKRQWIIGEMKDALDVIGRYAGWEIREYVEQNIKDYDALESDFDQTIENYDKEEEEMKEHFSSVLQDIREMVDETTELLRAPRIDKRKVSEKINDISRKCWQEM